jgi:type IV pilus assembly protein PilC
VAQFKYKAKDASGRVRSGTVTAASKNAAKDQLAKLRLRPITIVASKLDGPDGKDAGFLSSIFVKDKNGRTSFQPFGPPIPSTKDLVVFTKQFATMISSGVPLMQALGILAGQQRIPSFGEILDKIRFAVENGAKLSDALEAYPRIFDTLYVAMVRAGEESGSLDGILLKLVTYIEKASKIKGQVKSAMMYPAVVVVVAVVVVSALLLFVVPTFAKQYQDGGKPLPELTQLVVNLSDILANYWYVIFGGIGALIVGFRVWMRTETGHAIFDQYILKAPVIGDLLRKIAVGRFCSTMATMLTSGVNLLQALTICAASAGNKTIEDFVLKIRGGIEAGAKMSEPLGQGTLSPPMVVSMVSVGEATGALDDMLVKVSEFYEDEVDLAVKGMLSMIEPIMIVVIGGIVGFIVIAMYLPVFDLGNLQG